MDMLLQTALNGLTAGASYAIFAIGFTLVLGVHKVLNLAQGYLFAWSAIVGLYVVRAWDFPWIAAILAGLLTGGILAVLSDLLVFQPLQRRKAPESATLIGSIGISLILQQYAQQVTNTNVFRFPEKLIPSAVWSFGGIYLSAIQAIILLTSVVMVIALTIFAGATQRGRRMRAVAEKPETARLMGINPATVRSTTFFIAGAFAGIAGVLVGTAYNSVSYVMGEPYLLVAMAAVVVGGMGSVTGALIGSIILGVAKSFTMIYLSDTLSDAVPFFLLFLVLLAKPEGLISARGNVSGTRAARS